MTTCGTPFFSTVQATERSAVPFFADVQPQEMLGPSSVRFRTTANIERLGTAIQIVREGEIINTKALIAPLTRVSTPRTLQLIRTASFPAQSGIQGGDLFFDIPNDKYYLFLIETRLEAGNDSAALEGMISWCNHVAAHLRLMDKPTGVGGVQSEFVEIASDIRVSIEYISTSIREREPGVFRDSSHRCFVQSINAVVPFDRLRIMDEDFRVDDIDRVTYPGIQYCVLSRETREK